MSTHSYVNPMVALSISALLLKEQLGIGQVAGGLVVVSSVLLIYLGRQSRSSRRRRSSSGDSGILNTSYVIAVH